MGSQALVIDHSQSEQLRKTMRVLVLDGISSLHTRRAYEHALDEFLVWFHADPARRLDKATVQSYRAELEKKHLAASSINVRMSAIRKLAAEAGDNGLLPPQVAAAVGRVHGARRAGMRLGNWLAREEAEQLLALPNRITIKGLRDRALLGALVGAGLRRSEASRLTFEHLRRREGRWVIADLLGKHGRLRTVPIPDWCKTMIDEWAGVAAISCGAVFRGIYRSGRIRRTPLSPQSIFSVVKAYAALLGTRLAPHDLRRTWAKLAHKGAAPLEQIQLSMGHASIVTTELYLGVKQNLSDAPCDHLGLQL